MKRLSIGAVLAVLLVLPVKVSAVSVEAPPVPDVGRELMPRADTLAEGLREILMKLLPKIQPELSAGLHTAAVLLVIVLLVSLVQAFSDGISLTTDLVGAVAVGAALLQSAHSMIRLGAETITSLSEYGKLLLPVLTAALAAQGGITTATALYTGAVLFLAVLGKVITALLVPGIYIFLALSMASAALEEETIGKLKDSVKNLIYWLLKTLLTVFTGYLGITGVVSGTTDAAALKAAKAALSGVVPVVGGILSDASEAVLVSAALAKNAAGIYGILALISVFLTPFLHIGVQYLLLKLTGALCGFYGTKRISTLIGDFSAGMGLLLAITGSLCLMLLISSVCFLRGVG